MARDIASAAPTLKTSRHPARATRGAANRTVTAISRAPHAFRVLLIGCGEVLWSSSRAALVRTRESKNREALL